LIVEGVTEKRATVTAARGEPVFVNATIKSVAARMRPARRATDM
jgi:hypothetical protein